MAQRPAYAREILEMRRFGDRRPIDNMVFITDERLVRAACALVGFSAVLVEPFLPYNLDFCFDLDVWILMTGDERRVRECLRRAKPRKVTSDREGRAFWKWIDWLIEVRSGRRSAASTA